MRDVGRNAWIERLLGEASKLASPEEKSNIDSRRRSSDRLNQSSLRIQAFERLMLSREFESGKGEPGPCFEC